MVQCDNHQKYITQCSTCVIRGDGSFKRYVYPLQIETDSAVYMEFCEVGILLVSRHTHEGGEIKSHN